MKLSGAIAAACTAAIPLCSRATPRCADPQVCVPISSQSCNEGQKPLIGISSSAPVPQCEVTGFCSSSIHSSFPLLLQTRWILQLVTQVSKHRLRSRAQWGCHSSGPLGGICLASQPSFPFLGTIFLSHKPQPGNITHQI